MTNVKPEKRYKYIWDNDVHPLKYGIKIELILNIYGARSIFLIFCIHKDSKLCISPHFEDPTEFKMESGIYPSI